MCKICGKAIQPAMCAFIRNVSSNLGKPEPATILAATITHGAAGSHAFLRVVPKRVTWVAIKAEGLLCAHAHVVQTLGNFRDQPLVTVTEQPVDNGLL